MKKISYRIKNTLREAEASKWLAYIKLVNIPFAQSANSKLGFLCGAINHTSSFLLVKWLISFATKYASASVQSIRRSEQDAILEYSLIIKPYVSPTEKGILLISFESEIQKLIVGGFVTDIQKYFRIIFLPSWTGLFSKPLMQLAHVSTDHVFVMPVHAHERQLVSLLGSKFHSLPFNASSWVNNALYKRRTGERKIDCLMVANFSEFKRHWLLFDLLSNLDETYSVTCVGVPLGSRNAQSIADEAAIFGLPNVDIVENPSQEKLREYFLNAKVFCAMSFREGSFIAVAESLLSGTPVLAFQNAQFGTKSLISESNGRLIASRQDFAHALEDLLQNTDHKQVQQDAHQSIGAGVNVPELNKLLEQTYLSLGEQWTKDIIPFFSQRLHFYYLEPQKYLPDITMSLDLLKQVNVVLK